MKLAYIGPLTLTTAQRHAVYGYLHANPPTELHHRCQPADAWVVQLATVLPRECRIVAHVSASSNDALLHELSPTTIVVVRSEPNTRGTVREPVTASMIRHADTLLVCEPSDDPTDPERIDFANWKQWATANGKRVVVVRVDGTVIGA